MTAGLNHTSSIKRLALVAGDKTIKGTGYEGGQPGEHFTFLKELLEKQAEFASLGFDTQGFLKKLQHFNQPEAEHFHHLKPGQSLLFSTGWGGLQMGHAILIEVEKKTSGNFIFHIFNTGEGSEEDQKRLEGYKTKSKLSLVIDHVSKEKVTDELFTHLKNLTYSRSGKSDLIYHDLLMYLEGKEVAGPSYGRADFFTPQRSGTCSWKPFMSAIKRHCGGDYKLYRRVKHLIWYHIFLKLKDIDHSRLPLDELKVVEFSSRNFAQSLLKSYEQGIIDEKKRDEYIAVIPKKFQKEKPKVDTSRVAPKVSPRAPKTTVAPLAGVGVPRKGPRPRLAAEIIFPVNPNFEQLKEFISRASSLSILSQYLMQQLPLPQDPVWLSFDANQSLHLMEQLSKLTFNTTSRCSLTLAALFHSLAIFDILRKKCSDSKFDQSLVLDVVDISTSHHLLFSTLSKKEREYRKAVNDYFKSENPREEKLFYFTPKKIKKTWHPSLDKKLDKTPFEKYLHSCFLQLRDPTNPKYLSFNQQFNYERGYFTSELAFFLKDVSKWLPTPDKILFQRYRKCINASQQTKDKESQEFAEYYECFLDEGITYFSPELSKDRIHLNAFKRLKNNEKPSTYISGTDHTSLDSLQGYLTEKKDFYFLGVDKKDIVFRVLDYFLKQGLDVFDKDDNRYLLLRFIYSDDFCDTLATNETFLPVLEDKMSFFYENLKQKRPYEAALALFSIYKARLLKSPHQCQEVKEKVRLLLEHAATNIDRFHVELLLSLMVDHKKELEREDVVRILRVNLIDQKEDALKDDLRPYFYDLKFSRKTETAKFLPQITLQEVFGDAFPPFSAWEVDGQDLICFTDQMSFSLLKGFKFLSDNSTPALLNLFQLLDKIKINFNKLRFHSYPSNSRLTFEHTTKRVFFKPDHGGSRAWIIRDGKEYHFYDFSMILYSHYPLILQELSKQLEKSGEIAQLDFPGLFISSDEAIAISAGGTKESKYSGGRSQVEVIEEKVFGGIRYRTSRSTIDLDPRFASLKRKSFCRSDDESSLLMHLCDFGVSFKVGRNGLESLEEPKYFLIPHLQGLFSDRVNYLLLHKEGEPKLKALVFEGPSVYKIDVDCESLEIKTQSSEESALVARSFFEQQEFEKALQYIAQAQPIGQISREAFEIFNHILENEFSHPDALLCKMKVLFLLFQDLKIYGKDKCHFFDAHEDLEKELNDIYIKYLSVLPSISLAPLSHDEEKIFFIGYQPQDGRIQTRFFELQGGSTKDLSLPMQQREQESVITPAFNSLYFRLSAYHPDEWNWLKLLNCYQDIKKGNNTQQYKMEALRLKASNVREEKAFGYLMARVLFYPHRYPNFDNLYHLSKEFLSNFYSKKTEDERAACKIQAILNADKSVAKLTLARAWKLSERSYKNRKSEITRVRTSREIPKDGTPLDFFSSLNPEPRVQPAEQVSAVSLFKRIVKALSIGKKRAQTDASLDQDLQVKINLLRDLQQDNLKRILELSASLPQDPSQGQLVELKRAGGVEKTPSIDELLGLFILFDRQKYLDRTYLSSEGAQELHSLVGEYLQDTVKLNQLESARQLLEEAKEGSEDEKAEIINQVMALSHPNPTYNPQERPEYLVFEALSKVTLREAQVQNLEMLRDHQDLMIHMIMGAGKSKVITPILAVMKAREGKLPFIVVPEPLYPTGKENVKTSIYEAFGNFGHGFEFSRDSLLTKDSLTIIYQNFLRYKAEKGFVYTTKESLQSFLLKTYELFISFENEQDFQRKDEIVQEIELSCKILDFMKTEACALLDEVHELLDCRKELNFTFGDKKSVPRASASLIKEIAVKLCEIDSLALRQNQQAQLPTTFYETEVRDPLVTLLKEKFPGIPEGYLTDTYKGPLDWLTKHEDRDLIALSKELLGRILPSALSKKRNENYGIGDKFDYAIPYKGNEFPSKKSEFASEFETLIYTYMNYLQSNIPKALSDKAFDRMYQQAKQEMRINRCALERTETYNHVQRKYGVDLSSHQAKEDFFAKVTYSSEDIAEFVLDFIAPDVKTYPLKLSANPQDLFDLFGSLQGWTGTPWNNQTFPKKMELQLDPSVETKSRELVEQLESGSIYPIDQSTDHEIFRNILTYLQRGHYHTLIDCGSLVKGKRGAEVAKEILEALHAFEGVVFYDEDDHLSILERSGHIVDFESSTIPKEKRFTFYDQRHTTGSDIKQPMTSCALVTFSETTKEYELFQSIWRMRGLGKGQRFDLCATQKVLSSLESVDGPHVLQFVQSNEKRKVLQDNFIARKQEIRGIVLGALKKRLFTQPFHKKVKIFKAAEEIIVKKIDFTPFELFGQLSAELSPDKIFEDLSTYWFTTLDRLKQEGVLDDVESIKKAIRDLKPVDLAPTYKSQEKSELEGSMEVAQEQEQQVERENEIEIESQARAPYAYKKRYIWPIDRSIHEPNSDLLNLVRSKKSKTDLKNILTPLSLQPLVTKVKNFVIALFNLWLSIGVYYFKFIEFIVSRIVESKEERKQIEMYRRHQFDDIYVGYANPVQSCVQLDDLLKKPLLKTFSQNLFDPNILISYNFLVPYNVYRAFEGLQTPLHHVVVYQKEDLSIQTLVIDQEDLSYFRDKIEKYEGTSKAKIAIYDATLDSFTTKKGDGINLEDQKAKDQFYRQMIQIKFLGGVCNYTDAELPYLEEWIKKDPEYLMQLFNKIIHKTPENPKRYQGSVIKALFDMHKPKKTETLKHKARVKWNQMVSHVSYKVRRVFNKLYPKLPSAPIVIA